MDESAAAVEGIAKRARTLAVLAIVVATLVAVAIVTAMVMVVRTTNDTAAERECMRDGVPCVKHDGEWTPISGLTLSQLRGQSTHFRQTIALAPLGPGLTPAEKACITDAMFRRTDVKAEAVRAYASDEMRSGPVHDVYVGVISACADRSDEGSGELNDSMKTALRGIFIETQVSDQEATCVVDRVGAGTVTEREITLSNYVAEVRERLLADIASAVVACRGN